MVDLVEWLRAHLDADAKANASPYSDGAWHTRGCASVPDVFGQETSECDCGVPARVLREIDSKRRTLVRCEEEMLSNMPRLRHFAKQTVREMALPYNDRPGYEEAVASYE